MRSELKIIYKLSSDKSKWIKCLTQKKSIGAAEGEKT